MTQTKRDFLDVTDLSGEELVHVLDLSERDPAVSARQISTKTATTESNSAAWVAHSGVPVVNSPSVRPDSMAAARAVQISMAILVHQKMQVFRPSLLNNPCTDLWERPRCSPLLP